MFYTMWHPKNSSHSLKIILPNKVHPAHPPPPHKKRHKLVHMDVLIVFKGLSAPYNSYLNDMIPKKYCAPQVHL